MLIPLLLLGLVVVGVAVRLTAGPAAPSFGSVRVGDYALLHPRALPLDSSTPGTGVIAAATPDDLDRITRILTVSHDTIGYAQMLDAGRVFNALDRTAVLVIDEQGAAHYQVRIVAGPRFGQAWWVSGADLIPDPSAAR